VWIAPQPERSARQAAELGLRLELERDVDMGGFGARIQALRKGRGGGAAGPVRTGGRPR
jgi:hypothetical protein